MRFNYGTDILNFEGEKVGELEHVVIDPGTNQVTSLVAKKGFLLPDDKVIPISLVMDATEDHIKLYDFEGSFEDLDDYVEINYVMVDETHYPDEDTAIAQYDENIAPLMAYPPAGTMGLGFAPVIYYPDGIQTRLDKNVPAGTENIAEGDRVVGLDGEHVGDVEEVIVEPESDKITHFVISKGILFSEEKMIPASWVRGFDDHKLKLLVNSEVIERLPEKEAR